MIGRVVGQYKILEKLGEGGMGSVYKGIDLMVEREVAVKMLRPEIAREPELVERFRSEAITLAKLNNPGIATLYNFFRQGDDFFMVMEFVSGQTLDSLIRHQGAMDWQRAVPLFRNILECIQPAHNAGILHRDIKPANIMLTSWGGVKVMDFGIARVLGTARMTREGRMVGTIEYIAPERIKGDEADLRADIYSLGVVLYEMLSGRLPFESTSEYEIMRGHVQDSPPSLRRFAALVPSRLEAVVMKSLAKPPEERFQSCSDFINSLQTAYDAEGGAAHLHAAQTLAGFTPAFDHDMLKPTVLAAATAPEFTPIPDVALPATLLDSPVPPAQIGPAGISPSSTATAGVWTKWKLYVAGGVVVAALALAGLFLIRGKGPAGAKSGAGGADAVPAGQQVAPSSTSKPSPMPSTPVDGGQVSGAVRPASDSEDPKAREQAAKLREQQRRHDAALKALDDK